MDHVSIVCFHSDISESSSTHLYINFFIKRLMLFHTTSSEITNIVFSLIYTKQKKETILHL